MEQTRVAHVPHEEVTEVAAQTPVTREFYCRGVRLNQATHLWDRCGNQSKYYVFVEGADEPRQAICGVCRRKCISGRLTVLR